MATPTHVIGQAELRFAASHPALAGHFPGHPLVPGVLLLAEVIEAASRRGELAERIGPVPRIAAVKFLAPVYPEQPLEIRFDLATARTGFEIRHAERVVVAGQFEAAAPRQGRHEPCPAAQTGSFPPGGSAPGQGPSLRTDHAWRTPGPSVGQAGRRP